jgi:hypothetical protein
MKVTTIVRVFTLLSEALMQFRRGLLLQLVTNLWPGLMPRVVAVTRKLDSFIEVQRAVRLPFMHTGRLCSQLA